MAVLGQWTFLVNGRFWSMDVFGQWTFLVNGRFWSMDVFGQWSPFSNFSNISSNFLQ
jgi:hypothetical protein